MPATRTTSPPVALRSPPCTPARSPFAYPELLREEGLEAHITPQLWLLASPEPNHFVDITDTYERKLAALRCHASQMTDPDGGAPERLQQWLRLNAERGSLPEGHLAEAFQLVGTA